MRKDTAENLQIIHYKLNILRSIDVWEKPELPESLLSHAAVQRYVFVSFKHAVKS
jgi:hypothetical protein